jgi:hypothetical protein
MSPEGVDIRVWTPVGEKDVGVFPLSVAIKVRTWAPHALVAGLSLLIFNFSLNFHFLF